MLTSLIKGVHMVKMNLRFVEFVRNNFTENDSTVRAKISLIFERGIEFLWASIVLPKLAIDYF